MSTTSVVVCVRGATLREVFAVAQKRTHWSHGREQGTLLSKAACSLLLDSPEEIAQRLDAMCDDVARVLAARIRATSSRAWMAEGLLHLADDRITVRGDACALRGPGAYHWTIFAWVSDE